MRNTCYNPRPRIQCLLLGLFHVWHVTLFYFSDFSIVFSHPRVAESLFRNAVSANKPKDSSTDSSGYHTPGTGSVTGGTPRGSGGGGERGLATQSTSLKGAYPYAQQQQGGGQGGAYANANDTEMRRPATSGEQFLPSSRFTWQDIVSTSYVVEQQRVVSLILIGRSCNI